MKSALYTQLIKIMEFFLRLVIDVIESCGDEV